MPVSPASIPIRTSFFQQNQFQAFNQNFHTYKPPAVRMSPFVHEPRPLHLDEMVAFYNSKAQLFGAPPPRKVDAWA